MAGVLVLLLACTTAAPPNGGVYRSGPNAITRGTSVEPVLVWGTSGTSRRVPTAGADGTLLLGEAGPLWIVDRELPAPPKSTPVAAVMVERAGFRMKSVLGGTATTAPDPAKAGGVYVRSVLKMRRDKAPPVYMIAATGDEVGAGTFGGPADVRKGANCLDAVGLMDDKGDALYASIKLEAATRICAVPTLVPPVDRDGDGVLDVLVYGQQGNAGFRSWFRVNGTTLEPGPEDVWEGIP